MAWSDAARAAALEARRLHAKSKVHDPGRTALARAILGERNKNVMNQSMVSVHGGSYGKAIAARNRDAVSRAAGMLRADRLVKPVSAASSDRYHQTMNRMAKENSLHLRKQRRK